MRRPAVTQKKAIAWNTKNLKIYQPDGTFRTGGLCIADDRIAAAAPSAAAQDMGGLYAVPAWWTCIFTAAWVK